MTKRIQYKHPKTKKMYICEISEQSPKCFSIEARKKLKEQANYDYRKTLTPEQRAKSQYVKTDFNCPHCKKKTKHSVRKETLTYGFLFVKTDLIDIYKCKSCGNEFEDS